MVELITSPQQVSTQDYPPNIGAITQYVLDNPNVAAHLGNITPPEGDRLAYEAIANAGEALGQTPSEVADTLDNPGKNGISSDPSTRTR